MLQRQDILGTLRMLQEEYLDVRTVTLGVNLNGCARRDPAALADAVYTRVVAAARGLVACCDECAGRYGVPVINKRIAISPASILLEGHNVPAAVGLAEALDRAACDVGVDLLGGFTALVHKGMTPGEGTLIAALPQALTRTGRVCASVNVATTRAGINADAIRLVSGTLLEA
ncbi:MAG: DUF711 family protein, partial [Kiritimatiellae bacterium]|nr:DUF711 family protein [Kiritimatiellia bacterium]